MFSNSALKKLIIPLFLEQLLVMLVGIADTFIVAFVSEEAVSGVSLVNSFNTVFVFLFTALASGGAVVISQYIGRKDASAAGNAASQLLMVSILFSVAASLLVLWGNEGLMRLLFGQVEPEVMDACVTYLRISAYSYPALAVYNAGAALYRSFGKTSTTMHISVISNIINVAGNVIARRNPVRYDRKVLISWDGAMLQRILRIAVPNGVESGIFQLVKVALSSIVALFGTQQIAANGVAQSIWSMAALVCVTMGPVFITVIGQAMGAGDIAAAEEEFRRLMKVTLLFSVAWNLLVFACTPLLMLFFELERETKTLVMLLVLVHNTFTFA